MDTRDWIIVGSMVAIQIAGTVFVFKFPTDMNFATWGTVCSVLTSAYHYLVIKDSKAPDAAS